MSTQRLLDALTHINPSEIDHMFGNEGQFLFTGSPTSMASVNRVAIFAESFFPKMDGVAKLAYLTLRYLQQTGREVIVFAPDIAPYQVGPSQIIPLCSASLPFAPETRLAFPSRSISAYLDDFQPDLIHLFSPAIMSVSGMWQGRRRNIPVIANYQTDLPAYTRHYGFGLLSSMMQDWLRYIHNGCQLTLVPSNHTLRELHQNDYKNLRLWRRGVDLDRFSPVHRSAAWRERLLGGRDPKSLLCVYVGRLAAEKRVDLLIDVARLPGVALTIIGDGATRDDLEKLFAGTGTLFTGYMYGADLSNAYASADVFVFPGPSETFGQVVQEAQASGLPAVIVNQGGITDVVTDRVNGFVCPPNPAAFAAAVRRLQATPELRFKMAANARQTAERYPWTAIMSELEMHYQEAIQRAQRSARNHQVSSLSDRARSLLQWHSNQVS